MTRTQITPFIRKRTCCLIAFFYAVGVRSIITETYDEEECDYNQLQNCSTAFGSVASDFDVTIPTSEETLKIACFRLNEGFNCVDRFVKNCYRVNHQILYQVAVKGAKTTTEKLCSNNSTSLELFERPNSCLRKSNFSTSCGNYLERTSEVLQSGRDMNAEDVVKTICCSWNSFVNCKAKSVEEICGQVESAFIRLLFQSFQGDLVLSHCYGYDVGVWPGCSSASTPFSFPSPISLYNFKLNGGRVFLNALVPFLTTAYAFKVT